MEFFDMCYFSDYIFDAFILERLPTNTIIVI